MDNLSAGFIIFEVGDALCIPVLFAEMEKCPWNKCVMLISRLALMRRRGH